MDLRSQALIKELVEKEGARNVLVVLGSPDPESAELYAETVVLGDPTYAGPLTEANLGLDVYHVIENEVKQAIPEEVWEREIGVMEDVLEAEEIAKVMSAMRQKGAELSR